MSAENSSSMSTEHYKNLVGTISELKADLERTVAKLFSLEEQNRNLQANYQTVKEELIESRKKYNEVNQNYMTTVSEKFEAERQYEAFMDKIKSQLTEKTKEFEQVRDKFVPQDIDYIRIKVQEELEIPHKARIQSMEAELEKSKEAYYLVRRELERCKSEFESYSQNQKRFMSAQQDEYEAVVQSMRQSIIELQNKKYSSEKDDMIRNQRVQIHELEHNYEVLRAQIKAATRERDDAIYNMEQMKSKQQESLLQLKSKYSILDADRQGYDHKVSVLQAEIDQKDGQLRNARSVAEDLGRELLQLKGLITEKDRELATMKEDVTGKVELVQSSIDSERRHLTETIEMLSIRLKDREDTIRRLHKQYSDLQLRAESFDVETRKSYTSQINELKQKLENVEHLYSESRISSKEIESKYALDILNRTAEIDYLQSELSTLKREKEILHNKLNIQEQNMEAYRTKTSTLLHDTNLKVAGLENQLREQRVKLSNIEAELLLANKRCQEMDTENKALRESTEQLRQSHASQWETLQREVQQRYEALGNACKEKIKAARLQLKTSVAKERKRGDMYKEKAMEAARRGRTLTGAVAAAVGDYPTLLAELQGESDRESPR